VQRFLAKLLLLHHFYLSSLFELESNHTGNHKKAWKLLEKPLTGMLKICNRAVLFKTFPAILDYS